MVTPKWLWLAIKPDNCQSILVQALMGKGKPVEYPLQKLFWFGKASYKLLQVKLGSLARVMLL